jgi:hypothetical protein
VNGKRFLIGFLVVVALVAAVSVYVSRTISKTDTTFTAALSPDKRYKAVVVSVEGGGARPFCYDGVAIFLAVYPDEFAANDKAYEVFATPCLTPAGRAPAPTVKWTANDAVEIAYTPVPHPDDPQRWHMRLIDASQFVHIGYVARK